MKLDRIIDIMDKLNILSKDNYSEFEVALALFLRSDTEQVKALFSNLDLNSIVSALCDVDSILNKDIKDVVDKMIFD